MKRFRFPLLLIAASVLLLGMVAVACGDDDDDDGDDGGSATATGDGNGSVALGAYLKDVNDIQEDVSTATDSIGEEAFSDPARARQALSAAIDVAESAATALGALDVAPEATSEHERLITAGENLAAVAQSVSDEMQGMEPGAEFDAFAEDVQAPGSELSDALDEMVAACEAMEALSEEYKTGVDLACPASRS